MTTHTTTSDKATVFTVLDQRAAEIAKAISHPARITILRLLAARGTCICGEIVEGLPLSQSTVSQHLKALKEAGLIRGVTDGPRSCYCLNITAFEGAAAALGDLMTGIRQIAVGCCCEPSPVAAHGSPAMAPECHND
jgi:ArsR family transcriptional regulator